jgi:hypothetical protein
LWAALLVAADSGANLVALVTDGDASDTPEAMERARPWVANGPPVVVLGVGQVNEGVAALLTAGNGGSVHRLSDAGAAINTVVEHLAVERSQPYIIEYVAPSDGGPNRKVTVAVGNTHASANYVVPQPGAPGHGPAHGYSGIYVNIDGLGARITHTLAGVPHWDRPAERPALAVTDEVNHALWGATALSFEAGSPTTGAWFDDLLTARLTLRRLFEADLGNDDERLAATADIRVVPAELLCLHAPLWEGDGPPLFQTGPRVVVIGNRPLGWDTQVHRADILPTAGYRTAGEGKDSFVATLRRSLRLAVVEGSLYADSTVRRIGDAALRVLSTTAGLAADDPLRPWTRLIDTKRGGLILVPERPGEFAFWAIDPRGSVIGILPDGTGGGINIGQIASQCKQVSQLTAAMQLAAASYGYAMSAALSLGKAIARGYLRAAVVVATMDAPEIPDVCANAAKDLGCDLLKDAIPYAPIVKNFKSTKAAAEAVGKADDLAEAMTGSDLIQCFD